MSNKFKDVAIHSANKISIVEEKYNMNCNE